MLSVLRFVQEPVKLQLEKGVKYYIDAKSYQGKRTDNPTYWTYTGSYNWVPDKVISYHTPDNCHYHK